MRQHHQNQQEEGNSHSPPKPLAPGGNRRWFGAGHRRSSWLHCIRLVVFGHLPKSPS